MMRNDAQPDSDVDLLMSFLALGGMLLDTQDLPGRRGDVITESGLHPALRARIQAEESPL